MAFTLPDLPYPHDALEPHIDAQTMQIHHGKHHAAYVAKGNDAVAGTPLADVTCPWQASARLDQLPADKQTAARNNVGGHANHSLFWTILAPVGQGGQPAGALLDAINTDCGGMDKLKADFAAAAAGRFGSGWAWLVVNPAGKLEITSTPNQDNPAMPASMGGTGARPILGLDVWEHAYYLKYQNRRPEYIEAFFNVVNWNKVGEYYQSAKG